MNDPRQREYQDDRDLEIQELRDALEQSRSEGVIQAGRNAGNLLGMVGSWIDRKRTEARKTYEGLSLDAPHAVCIGIRAWIRALDQFEREFKQAELSGLQEIRRLEGQTAEYE